MLPLVYKFTFDTPLSIAMLYVVAAGLVVYSISSGWRGATGALDPKTGKFAEPTRDERLSRARLFAAIGVGLAGVGLYYALPEVPFFGRGKDLGIPIHTYGVLVGTGFITAVTAAAWMCQREWPGEVGLKRRDQLFDLAFYVFIGVMIGSRDVFIITKWSTYMGELKRAEAYAMVLDVLVVVGIVVALAAGDRIVKSEATRKKISDNAFTYFIATSLGSRVVFSFFFGRGPETLAEMLGGGLVFYGGVIGGVLTSVWYARKNDIEFMRLADIGLPVLSLGHAFGRLGCFSAGCCWGKNTLETTRFAVHFPGKEAQNLLGGLGGVPSLAWQDMATDTRYVVEATGQITHELVPGAVQISQWVTEHHHTLPVYPVQLYESLGEMILFGLMLTARNYRRFHGQIFGMWLMCYAVLRTTIEVFRGDTVRGTLHSLLEYFSLDALAAAVPLEAWYNVSISQFISMCLFALGATILTTKARALKAQPTLDLNALAVG